MRFRPSPGLTLALLPLALACTVLGNWQVGRMHSKQELFDSLASPPLLTLEEALHGNLPYARISELGSYETGWHLLLDNRLYRGRPGVHALSLFRTSAGTPVLVNRGWLAMPADRSALPDVPTPPGRRVVSGLLAAPPAGGVRLGAPDRILPLSGARLVTYLDISSLAAALGESLPDRMILLDAEDASGFEDRHWQASTIPPAQHRAYAVQWFALAIACFIAWLALGVRRAARLEAGRAAGPPGARS